MGWVNREMKAAMLAGRSGDGRPPSGPDLLDSAQPLSAVSIVRQRIAEIGARLPTELLDPFPIQPSPAFAAKLGVATLVASLAIILVPGQRPQANLIAGGLSTNARETIGIVSARNADALSMSGSVSGPTATSSPSNSSLGDGNDRNRGAAPFVIDLADLSPDDPDQNGEWVEPELEPEDQWVDGGNGVALPDVLLRIRFCESTNDYGAAHINSSARGAYQFLTKSWIWYGHAERFGVPEANLATPAQQDEAALLTLNSQGAGPWAESRPCWDDPEIDPRYPTAGPPPTVATTTTASTTTSGPTTTTPATTSTTVPSSTTTTTTASTTTTQPSSTTISASTTTTGSTTTSSTTTTQA
ncbi:MAG: hypothetical protein GY724_12465 [Actinomycetia bacterium]|nr:hypothetical protein [Actinomycetes bacterium]